MTGPARCGEGRVEKSYSLSRDTRTWSMLSPSITHLGQSEHHLCVCVCICEVCVCVMFFRDKIATGSFDKTCKVWALYGDISPSLPLSLPPSLPPSPSVVECRDWCLLPYIQRTHWRDYLPDL